MTASTMVSTTAFDRLLDELGRIVDDGVLEPVGEVLGELVHGRLDRLRRRQRVRSRQLEDAERDGGIAIEIGVGRVVERRELDAGDILQPHHRVGVCLTTMSANWPRDRQAGPSVCTATWKARGWSTGGWLSTPEATCTFCPCRAVTTSPGGQAERLQAIGIEPDAHRIVAAAEHGDRADAVDAVQHVDDADVGVVGDEQRVARFVRRVEMHDHHQVGRALATVTPMLRTSAGRRGCAMATRFCTCTCAISRLVPRSKVTAIEKRPSPVEFDVT